MNRLNSPGPSALVLAMVLIILGGATWAAPPPLEELVPEGAVGFMCVRDAPSFFETVRAHPRYRLLSEPELQEFASGLAAGIRGPREQMARALGMELGELEKMLGGQICLAVLPRGERRAHFLLLADVTADPETARSALAKLLEHERRQGRYAVREESLRGHVVHVLEPVQAEPTATEGPGSGAETSHGEPPPRRVENPGFLTLSDGLLAIAASPDRTLIERYLVLREGGEVPSLADTEGFRRLRAYLGDAPDVVAFADTGAGLRAEVEGPVALDGRLGPGAAGALGIGLAIAGDGIAARGLLVAPAPRQGVLRAFPEQGGSVLPPPYVGERPGAYGGVRFDLATFWREIMATLQRDDPPLYAMVQQQLAAMPADVEADLIGAVGSRWFLYIPAPEAARRLDTAICVDLDRPDAFRAAWRQLAAALPPEVPLRTVEFMGVTIYQFGGQSGEPPLPPQKGWCLAVIGDRLVRTGGLELVKSVIEGESRPVSPLRGQAEFARLMGRVMEEPDAVLLLDGRVLMRWSRQVMEARIRKMAQATEPGPAAELPELPWDVMQKYQTRAVVAGRWNEDGLSIRAWLPDPPPGH